MKQEFYLRNRKNYLEKVQKQSLSLFFSGEVYPKSADQDYQFSVDKNFYYLTGLNQANLILALVKGEEEKAILFIEENDPVLSKWVGSKLEIEEAKALSGIDDVRYLKDFNSFLFYSFNSIRYSKESFTSLYLSLERRDDPQYSSIALRFANEFKTKYPEVLIKDSYNIVIGLRMIKSEDEIALIKESITSTKEGIEVLMTKAKAGLYEYQLEAYFDFHLKYNGQKTTSFETIAASGKNATILHYVSNDSLLKDGELILFDLGCSTDFYISDISRTFPINGKFTQRQKDVYEEVLAVNKKCIEILKPGLTWQELNEYARELLTEGLKRLGLLKDKSELSRYYWHSIGHFIGMDAHDPGQYNKEFEKGMVITIEPGIYIEDEGIGIRIEDNLLITEDGAQNLSAEIIKEFSEIEEFMNK